MGFKIFAQQLIAVDTGKIKMLLNNPFYIALPVLHLSKLDMYHFHYDYTMK